MSLIGGYMKKRLIVTTLLALLTQSFLYSADEWACKTTGQQSQISPMVNVAQPLIVIYVDFPDGRLSNGSLPTQDSDTSLVANINAVGSMGYYRPDQPSPFRKQIRKYVYDDYWDMIFSSGEYVGSRHPDYATHQGYLPPQQDDPFGQAYNLTVYGSIRDYWNEVSYGNVQLYAYQTRSGSGDKYHTGIVNRIITANGKNYVQWIKLDSNKSSYGINSIDPISEACAKVRAKHQLLLSDPEYIEFDIDSFPSNGKIAVVTAGGALGGWSYLGGQVCIVPEKLEYLVNTTSSVIFNSIAELAHELGHTFNLPHFVAGSYDLMFWGGFGDRRYYFCPPHINPKYKIALGWIRWENVQKITSNTSTYLPPIDNTGQVALVTLYGDAGRNNNLDHSEYFIVEYRKREAFNRFVGGPDATGFTGGALIWHYSRYTEFPILTFADKQRYTAVDTYLGLKVAGYDTTFRGNTGSPSQLFYPSHPTIDALSSPNSSSAENLTTGISLNSFSYSGGNLAFNVDYTLGAIPQWNTFVQAEQGLPSVLSNTVFIEGYHEDIFDLTIADNAQIQLAPSATIAPYRLIANASTQNSISFDGVGFGANRATWNGIILFHGSNPHSLTRCLISHAKTGVKLMSPFTLKSTIENNQFVGCETDLHFQNDFSNTSSPDLSGFDNNSFTTMKLIGKWQLASASTFTIPAAATLHLMYDNGYKAWVDIGSSHTFSLQGNLSIDGGSKLSNGTIVSYNLTT